MQLRTILVILQHGKATQKWSVSAISRIPAEAIFVHKEYCLEGVFLIAFVWNSSKMLTTIAKSFSAGKRGSNFKACQGPCRSLMRLKNQISKAPPQRHKYETQICSNLLHLKPPTTLKYILHLYVFSSSNLPCNFLLYTGEKNSK